MHGWVHDHVQGEGWSEVCILTIITDVEKHGKISSMLSLFWGFFFIAQNRNMHRDKNTVILASNLTTIKFHTMLVVLKSQPLP